MSEQTTSSPTTKTENPAGSPKVDIGPSDYKRFEALLKGVIAVPKEEAVAADKREGKNPRKR